MSPVPDLLTEFIVAACDPHDSGALARAEAIRSQHPEVAAGSIYSAAILGDEAGVRGHLALDAANATAVGGPRGWDALTYLCFSTYLRLDRARAGAFVRTAQALLDAGASASQRALYGAAGIAHHPELTRLLMERGADPNDDEVPYHTPETTDNAALKILVESGKVNPDSLATMLLRKHDWHDLDGVRWLLEHGADPNRMTRWQRTAFYHGVLRDNALEILEVSLDHGADPALGSHGRSAIALAARRGRGDVLDLLERRGIPVTLHGIEELLAACARNRPGRIHAILAREPGLAAEVVAQGGTLLAEFAGVGNTAGVRHLLDLGVEVATPYPVPDGYWDISKESTALHVAAWRARHATVKLLIERGAPVNARDGRGRTPLALAVRACVDSYWTSRRSPESVEALLAAGALARDAAFPSGYAEVDDLLRPYLTVGGG